MKWKAKTYAAKKVTNLGAELAKRSQWAQEAAFDNETTAALCMLSLLKHFRNRFFDLVAERRLQSVVSGMFSD